MALPNLSGSNIQDTYQRLLHTSGENVYDGAGRLQPIRFSGSDVIVQGTLIANSYVVTESTTVSTSGSTIFGNSADDTHTFTGTVSGSLGGKFLTGVFADNALLIYKSGASAVDISSDRNIIHTIESANYQGSTTYYKVRNGWTNTQLFRIDDTGVAYWNDDGQDSSHAAHRNWTFMCNLDNVADSNMFHFKTYSTTLAKFIGPNTDTGVPAGIALSAHTSVSGDISASGDIFTKRIKVPYGGTLNISEKGGAEFAIDSHRLQVHGGIKVGSSAASTHQFTGSITASGIISSSTIIHGTQFYAANKQAVASLGTNIVLGSDSYGTKIDGSSLQISAGNVGITGSITAVQDLTGSGVLTYGTSGDNQLHTLYGKLKVVSSDITIGDGHVSASGDIRATGSIYALTGSFGTGTTTITDNIETTGNISSSGDIQSLTISTRDLEATGKVRIKGSDITLEAGNISASGDILTTGSFVAGGNVSAGEGGTGSFDHIITSTGSIEFRDGSTKLGSIKFDSSAGFQSLDNNDNSGKITSKTFHCTNHIENDGTIQQQGASTFVSAITASIVSASSTITANDINTRDLEATGKVRIKGSDITLENGHVSASGDIRATGSMYALTGSFGTGTTTITDSITTTGGITALGTIEGVTVRGDEILAGTGKQEITLGKVSERVTAILNGELRIKGSDITLSSGSVSASGDIRATGSM